MSHDLETTVCFVSQELNVKVEYIYLPGFASTSPQYNKFSKLQTVNDRKMSVLFRLASTPMKWARDSATTGGTRIDPAITRPIAIPHWIPYSYKLLVPKSSGHIPQFSREQLKDFLDGLDCDCLVPLPNDVQEYMLQRRMYSEIDYWRAEL